MGNVTTADVEKLLSDQLAVWDTARNNYTALSGVEVKQVKIGNATVKIQFNPARIVSTAAKVDTKSLKERKCFLCAENRPDVQEGLAWGTDYTVLVNPFPIFPKHLTIPCNNHVAQRIEGRIADMMDIAKDLDQYTLFYNGPKCGASAPDHMHFQAGNRGFLTCEDDINKGEKVMVKTLDGASLVYLKDLLLPFFLIEASDRNDGISLFNTVLANLTIPDGEPEPMLNILCWFADNKWYIMVVPRKKHRPSCYFAEGDSQILLSPASVDMGGVFITPVEKDFRKITAEDISTIINEVCLSDDEMMSVVTKIQQA